MLEKNQNSHKALSAKQSVATISCQLTSLSWALCREQGFLWWLSKSAWQQGPLHTDGWESSHSLSVGGLLCGDGRRPYEESYSELRSPLATAHAVFTAKSPFPTWNNATHSLQHRSSLSASLLWGIHNFSTCDSPPSQPPRADYYLYYKVINRRSGEKYIKKQV